MSFEAKILPMLVNYLFEVYETLSVKRSYSVRKPVEYIYGRTTSLPRRPNTVLNCLLRKPLIISYQYHLYYLIPLIYLTIKFQWFELLRRKHTDTTKTQKLVTSQ